MTLALLCVLAGLFTRLTGLDRAGMAFCYFKALTGYACMTCGTTRAFGHLSRFDLASAFAIQPLATAGVLTILLWGLADGLLLPSGRRTLLTIEGRTPRRLFLAGLALAALNWMYLLATGV